jgi:hypothetical protein
MYVEYILSGDHAEITADFHLPTYLTPSIALQYGSNAPHAPGL